mmetsp:Transcript_77327/g.151732  ORF Transcript_77327/g.151732 Transcript_77327/m.151732 type:complete len:173 (-) Transcript_77327:143-661(-)
MHHALKQLEHGALKCKKRGAAEDAISQRLPFLPVAWESADGVCSQLIADQTKRKNVGFGQVGQVPSKDLSGEIPTVAFRHIVATAPQGGDSQSEICYFVIALLPRVATYQYVVGLDIQVDEVAPMENTEPSSHIAQDMNNFVNFETCGLWAFAVTPQHAVPQGPVAKLGLDM